MMCRPTEDTEYPVPFCVVTMRSVFGVSAAKAAGHRASDAASAAQINRLIFIVFLLSFPYQPVVGRVGFL